MNFKNLLKLGTLTLLVTLVLSSLSYGQVVRYLNSTDGDDSYDGTSATHDSPTVGPKRTLTAAFRDFPGGAVVNMAAGNYVFDQSGIGGGNDAAGYVLGTGANKSMTFVVTTYNSNNVVSLTTGGLTINCGTGTIAFQAQTAGVQSVNFAPTAAAPITLTSGTLDVSGITFNVGANGGTSWANPVIRTGGSVTGSLVYAAAPYLVYNGAASVNAGGEMPATVNGINLAMTAARTITFPNAVTVSNNAAALAITAGAGSVTAASPTVINMASTAGLAVGDYVYIYGNVAAGGTIPDGVYPITALVVNTSITVTYDNSLGNTTGGGSVILAKAIFNSTANASGTFNGKVTLSASATFVTSRILNNTAGSTFTFAGGVDVNSTVAANLDPINNLRTGTINITGALTFNQRDITGTNDGDNTSTVINSSTGTLGLTGGILEVTTTNNGVGLNFTAARTPQVNFLNASTGTANVGGGASTTFNGTFTTAAAAGTVNLTGPVTVSGTFTNGAGHTIALGANNLTWNKNTAGGGFTNGGTITSSGIGSGYVIFAHGSTYGALTDASAGVFPNIRKTSDQAVTLTTSATVSGNVENTAAGLFTLNGATGITGGVTLSGTGGITLGAASTAIGGNVSVSGTGTFTTNAATITGTTTLSAGGITLGGNTTLMGAFTQSGGTLNFATFILDVKNNFTRNAGNVTPGTGTLQFSAGGSQVFSGGTNMEVYNFTVTGVGTGVTFTNGSLMVDNNVTIVSNTNVILGNYNIRMQGTTAAGTPTFANSGQYTSTGGGGIIFEGPSGVGAQYSITGNGVNSNIEVRLGTETWTVRVPAAQIVTWSGLLTLTRGTIDAFGAGSQFNPSTVLTTPTIQRNLGDQNTDGNPDGRPLATTGGAFNATNVNYHLTYYNLNAMVPGGSNVGPEFVVGATPRVINLTINATGQPVLLPVAGFYKFSGNLTVANSANLRLLGALGVDDLVSTGAAVSHSVIGKVTRAGTATFQLVGGGTLAGGTNQSTAPIDDSEVSDITVNTTGTYTLNNLKLLGTAGTDGLNVTAGTVNLGMLLYGSPADEGNVRNLTINGGTVVLTKDADLVVSFTNNGGLFDFANQNLYMMTGGATFTANVGSTFAATGASTKGYLVYEANGNLTTGAILVPRISINNGIVCTLTGNSGVSDIFKDYDATGAGTLFFGGNTFNMGGNFWNSNGGTYQGNTTVTAITGGAGNVTVANPAVLTVASSAGFAVGDVVYITGNAGTIPAGYYTVNATAVGLITINYDNSGGNNLGGGTVALNTGLITVTGPTTVNLGAPITIPNLTLNNGTNTSTLVDNDGVAGTVPSITVTRLFTSTAGNLNFNACDLILAYPGAGNVFTYNGGAFTATTSNTITATDNANGELVYNSAFNSTYSIAATGLVVPNLRIANTGNFSLAAAPNNNAFTVANRLVLANTGDLNFSADGKLIVGDGVWIKRMNNGGILSHVPSFNATNNTDLEYEAAAGIAPAKEMPAVVRGLYVQNAAGIPVNSSKVVQVNGLLYLYTGDYDLEVVAGTIYPITMGSGATVNVRDGRLLNSASTTVTQLAGGPVVLTYSNTAARTISNREYPTTAGFVTTLNVLSDDGVGGAKLLTLNADHSCGDFVLNTNASGPQSTARFDLNGKTLSVTNTNSATLTRGILSSELVTAGVYTYATLAVTGNATSTANASIQNVNVTASTVNFAGPFGQTDWDGAGVNVLPATVTGVTTTGTASIAQFNGNLTSVGAITLAGAHTNGTITASGDVTVATGGSMAASSNLTFIGTANATLTVPAAGAVVGSLTFNKTNNTNTVTLAGGNIGQVRNGGALTTFINGLFIVPSPLVFTMNQPNWGGGQGFTRAGVTGTNISHVVGSVAKVSFNAGGPGLGASSESRFEFPVGTNTLYRPVAITFNPSFGLPTMPNSTFTVNHVNANPGGAVALPIVDGVASGIDVARYPAFYWTIASAPSSIGPSTLFDLELTARGFTDFDDINNVRIIRRHGLVTDVTNQWLFQGTIGVPYDNEVNGGVPSIIQKNANAGLRLGGAVFTLGLKSNMSIKTAIPKQWLVLSQGEKSYNLANVFEGNVGSLTYTAQSSNGTILTTAITGSTLKLTPVAIGDAVVTIVASDAANNDFFAYSFDVNVGLTDVEEVAEIPTEFSLSQNYPNPFNPTTNIKFGLPKESNVTLRIFNILGEEVATLVNKVMPAGFHTINFDASKMTSGMYIYRIEADNFVQVKKMLLMK